MNKNQYKVEWPLIVSQDGVVLYDNLDTIQVTKKQARRMAKLHSQHSSWDFETVWKHMVKKGVAK